MNNTSNTWESYEKENKRRGVVASILIHAIVIALFFYFGFSAAYPPLIEGILINFGTTENGKGDNPSEVVNPSTELASVTAESTPTIQAQVTEQDVVTQDVVKAQAIKPEKKKEDVKPVKEDVKKPVKNEEKKPVKEEQKVDTKSMYTGKQSDENNPSNEGITYGPGDQGDPNGDITSKNYYGDNTGLGNENVGGYDLAGRNFLSIPPINEDYTETGKVVVIIKVDRNGNVLSANSTQKGSTTTDQKLKKLAEEAALRAKFSPDSKAAEEQWGTITFTFKLR